MQRIFIPSLLISLELLAGCQHLSSQEIDASVESSPKIVEHLNAPSQTFLPETLYALMVSEIALQRGHPEIAINHYIYQAEKTSDPGIAKRATKFALTTGLDDLVLKAAKIWLKASPNEPAAYEIIALQLIKQRKFDDAFAFIEKGLLLPKGLNLSPIAYFFGELEKDEQKIFIEKIDALINQHPTNTRLATVKIIIFKHRKQYESAITLTEFLHANDPSNSSWILLKAQLLLDAGEADNALAWLQLSAKKMPDDEKIQRHYAEILYKKNQLKEAYDIFSVLHAKYPNNSEYAFSLALISIGEKRFNRAKEHLFTLIKSNQLTDAAYYYLGLIAENENKLNEAIDYFKQVKKGPDFLNAFNRRMNLHAKQKQFDVIADEIKLARSKYKPFEINLYLIESSILSEYQFYDKAHEKLTEALNKYAGNIDLLYSRALLAEKRNNLALLERDLNEILAQDPDNSAALNALGYSLSNAVDRQQEAYELISKAYELNPDNPAILDSLGWINYQLGNLEKALEFLEAAYEKMPDHEVAAHLGEVLWVMGEKTKADAIWKKALKGTPKSPVILQTMQRLK